VNMKGKNVIGHDHISGFSGGNRLRAPPTPSLKDDMRRGELITLLGGMVAFSALRD
jgi:hypothetical protein